VAKFWSVGDREIVRAQRAAQQRQAEISDFHFTPQRSGGFLFNSGPELIDRDQKWDNGQENNQYAYDNGSNLESTFHGTSVGRGCTGYLSGGAMIAQQEEVRRTVVSVSVPRRMAFKSNAGICGTKGYGDQTFDIKPL